MNLLELQAMGLAHLDEYFGPWAMQIEPLQAALAHAQQIDLAGHVRQQQEARTAAADNDRTEFTLLDGGQAVISLHGPLMKRVSSMSAGTSTVYARRLLRAAVRDDRVHSIALHIDSPGGTVSGTQALADDVAEAAKAKPVVAYIEDLGASAAYEIAAQARQVFANRSALVGSIGTYAVLYDYSAAAAMQGIKVHLLSTGPHKGAGTLGTEITHPQLLEMQRIVDGLNAEFLEAVARGRKLPMSKVQELADGRVHLAADAQALGLIDGLQSFEALLASLARPAGRHKATLVIPTHESTEPENPEATMPPVDPTKPVQNLTADDAEATFATLVAACSGADKDPAWVCSQLSAAVTVGEAKKNWADHLQTQNDNLKAELVKAKSSATKPGVDRLATTTPTASSSLADPVAEWEAALSAKLATTKDRRQAVAAVAKEQPDLHQAYLAAWNERHSDFRQRRPSSTH